MPDTFARFAAQMTSHPRLTAAQEVELGRRVQADFVPLKDAASTPEERSRFRQGKRARDRMLLSNFRLVMKIVNKYRDRGVSIPDLVQEGQIGLLKAIDKFDPGMGYRFSTYAYWWINQAVQRAIFLQSRAVKLPVNKWENFYKLIKAVKELESDSQLVTVAAIAAKTNFSNEAIKELQSIFRHPFSIHANVPGAESLTFEGVIPSPDEPWDFVRAQEATEAVEKLLSKMSLKHGLVLRKRLGEGMTLEEIGNELGVRRSDIHAASKQAQKKLRGVIAASGYEFPLEA